MPDQSLDRGARRHLALGLLALAAALALLVVPPIWEYGTSVLGAAALVLPMVAGFALGVWALSELAHAARAHRISRAERSPLTEFDRREAQDPAWRFDDAPAWAAPAEAAWFAAGDCLVV